jgi:hypothetical protein
MAAYFIVFCVFSPRPAARRAFHFGPQEILKIPIVSQLLATSYICRS